MGENKLHFTYLYALLAAFWGYCFISSVIIPPFLAYYTFDETFIADSGVFLWYGITPRILDWPASPSVLIYGLIFGVSVSFQILNHLGELTGFLDAFSIMDKAAYNYLFEREPYIIAGRAIQMLMVLAVMLWTLRFLQNKQHPLLAGAGRWYIGVIVIATHLLWNNGVVLRPEAISAVFFIHILCRLIFSDRLEKSEILILSILFGLVVAERLIFLIMSPLFFAGIFLLSGVGKWKGIRFSIGVFVLSFLAFCPFILTDPLIVAKAFFGGILAKVNDNPMDSFFNWEFIRTYFDNPVGYLALGLTALGIWRIWKEKNLLYWIAAGNWFLFLFLVLRSSKIYDPHVLPAALVNLLIMGMGLITLADLIGQKRQWLVWGVATLIVAGEMVGVVSYHSWVRRDTNVYEAYRWIERELPTGARLLVNIDIGLLLVPDRAALDRQIEANENMDNQLNKLSYLMGLNQATQTPIEAEKFPIAASAFAFEDEKLFGLQYRLLRKYGDTDKRKRFNLDIGVEDNTLFYHGVLLPQARENFNNGLYDYWVTDEVLEGEQPYAEFSESDGSSIRVYRAVSDGR